VIKGRKLALSFVSLGNPHAVAFISRPVADFPLDKVGPAVENHPMFPRRINFEVARVLVSSALKPESGKEVLAVARPQRAALPLPAGPARE
jgi:diaminopimelate epimerase